MPTIHINLDLDSFRALAERAVEERRPIAWQAEVLVLQAIGLWPMPQPELKRQATAEAS